MKQTLETPNLPTIAGGYVCAVVTSALAAALIMTLAGQGEFMLRLVIGGMYIAIAGLPGFAATAYCARRHGWSGWLPFALAGGTNALLAWLLVGIATGSSMIGGSESEMLYASVRAGVAGGVAYWWFAYRNLHAV